MADTEALVTKLNECAEKLDFEGAFALVKENREELAKALQGAGIGDALKKTTKDRLLLSFVDGAGFAARPLAEALVRLERLISFAEVGALVLNGTWGLGTVRRLDYFYRRITVDFRTQKGHQFSYDAAIDMLRRAPDGHILVLRQADPAEFDRLLREQPGEFVKKVILSNGKSMTLIKLEDYCVQNGFVKSVNWKKFWDGARAELKQDKLVVIPTKKTEPITIRETEEDYGGGWLTTFCAETDPKLILGDVLEFVRQNKFKDAGEDVKTKIGERLAFAVTAARKVDDALFARLACLLHALGYETPDPDSLRGYLWERKRFIKAAAALPAREVGAMISFLANSAEAKMRLCQAVPEFCFTAVCEVVSQFRDARGPVTDAAGNVSEGYPYRAAIGAFMREPMPPATLTTLLVGKIESFGSFEYADVPVDGRKIKVLKKYELWKELPGLITLLTHAIALGEGRRSGETLKMQNLVRRLFGDKAWLEKMFNMLSAPDQALFFERFQASIAWDPSTHHTIVVRMTKIVPALEKHLVKVEKKREYARLTSPRSYALKKQDYLKLINVDMPENVRKIEFAKGFGDLSENAEYQYAKDEQRQLMQKQTLMQDELETVKPSEFADATTGEVMPGVTVVIAVPAGEKTYHVLGEWDNDTELGVLSSKARLAQNMLGKKVGDQFELPGTDGAMQFGRIVEIKALSPEIRAWMKIPAGLQI